MRLNKVRWIIFIASGLFLLTDQFLKWQALHHWTNPELIFPYFGWQLFLNYGVAFSLPLSNSLTMIITLPMIGLVFFLLIKELKKGDFAEKNIVMAWSMVLAGAISNLIDRIAYRHVIDYIIIGTAVINIADILIMGGLVLYLISSRTKNIPVSDQK